jgi:hypothetical protein
MQDRFLSMEHDLIISSEDFSVEAIVERVNNFLNQISQKNKNA